MDPAERIRELIVRGDNSLKHGDGARSVARARESYEAALQLAAEAGLAERVRPLVEARLSDLERQQ